MATRRADQDPDEVSLLINREEFRFWESVEITLSMDSYSTVSFTAPFEADRAEFREQFRPFSYQQVDVLIAGEQLFRGTMIDVMPRVSADKKTVEVTAYAAPGVLEDCNEPADSVPLEWEKFGLRDILDAIAEPFGLQVQVDDETGAKFKKVSLDADGQPQDFAADLARQRGLVVTSSPNGRIRCWKSIEPGAPVARLRQGVEPVTNVEPTFSPRAYFSQITGFAPTKGGRDGGRYTVQNPHLRTATRPLSFKVDDTDAADVPRAVRARMGRMFGNMAGFSVPGLPTWRDPKGNLWSPNTTVTLEAPDAMVYRETEMLVRAVTLSRTADEKSAALSLVLPGAFSGGTPERLPWDE